MDTLPLISREEYFHDPEVPHEITKFICHESLELYSSLNNLCALHVVTMANMNQCHFVTLNTLE